MKNLFNWQVRLGIVLLFLSALTISIHYMLFRDVKYLESFAITSLAYIFVEVLIVVLLIQGLLEYREKRALLKKLNMLIGTFYSEIGTALLKFFSLFDANASKISKELHISGTWTSDDFKRIEKMVEKYVPAFHQEPGNLEDFRRFLTERRGLLLNLLANPNLLEHETFTDLLWAVFHLSEELAARKDLAALSKTDHEHIVKDMNRAYGLILRDWILYMKHLKDNYPYLFSFAMRTNPFDTNARIEVNS
ncbi:MAG: hypothetical protein WCY36_07135 [Candidatus Omnitrophota bacterium]